VRVCLVYDHLFPQTIGGMERWMRDLALRLATLGHEVTYLTMRHWDTSAEPVLPGVRIVGLIDPGRVYADDRRTFGPPLGFGLAVARHLARHGRNYDVVHTASFPYFPILAAGAFRRSRGYRIVVDWPEVWTRRYWRHYAGILAGTIGWLVQRACLRVPHRAHTMSQLHARRLVAEGYRGNPVVLPGLYDGPAELSAAEDVDTSLVVYAGRNVKEKRVPALVRAFAHARATRPDLRLEIYGDGPERARVATLVEELGLDGSVDVAGRKSEEEISRALARAACLATASEREGYGLVVVEAAAHGTPSVVVAGPENAVTELLAEGINGTIAASASAEDLGAAILRVVEAGASLRDSTAGWFEQNAPRLRLDRSLDLVVEEYEAAGPPKENAT
jgi:glycosyltransferase involved in cell wall biosynthesis